MSLIRCDSCDAVIDSDDDPDCFIEAPDCIPYVKALEAVMCGRCRERNWDRQNERAMEG